MTAGLPLFRVRGISITAHWSWLVIAALVVWSLAGGVFPLAYPGLDGATYLVMAIVAALLFFGSVLLHELGHALTAVREGVAIERITLWLLGGVSHLRGRPRTPGAEFRVAIAGPLITLALAALFFAVALLGEAAGLPVVVVAVANYLALINGLLLVFNLAPALPLDGGRVLRSWLWRRQRSFLRATQWAARAGKGFGLALIAIGLVTFFTGTGLGGLWFVLLGWFLTQAAQAEADDALTRQSLQGLRVRDVMREDAITVPPDMRVEDFLELADRALFSTFPVVEHDELRGMVTLRQAARVPLEDRASRRVADIMFGPDEVPAVSPDEEAAETLPSLRNETGRAVVTEDGRVRGLLTAADMAQAMEVRLARGVAERDGRRRRKGVAVAALVLLAGVVVAGLLLYRPPLVVAAPGPAFDVAEDVQINGRDVTPVNGRYLATSVSMEQPNALGAIIAGIRPDQEVLRRSSVLPEDVPADRYIERQRELFRESRQMAAAAAARSRGLPVSLNGSGVTVTGTLPGAPADDLLRPGDVIVRAEGRRVEHIWQLQDLVAARPAGSTISMAVERDGRTLRLDAQTVSLPRIAQGVGIGIAGRTQDLRVDLPFEVDFAERREVGGPSAGAAYALAIADLLAQEDYAAGRDVAATGTIGIDGAVGPVGGVEQKAVGADRAGAEVFIVPAGEVSGGREVDGDLRVHGATSLGKALDFLEQAV